jgi:hypothetical protein
MRLLLASQRGPIESCAALSAVVQYSVCQHLHSKHASHSLLVLVWTHVNRKETLGFLCQGEEEIKRVTR